MNNFDRFRNKNYKKIVSAAKENRDFVIKGYPTTEITFSNGECQTVSLVNKQEQGYAYVFTKDCEPLNIGEVFTCKDLHLMVTDKITIIKDVAFQKYVAIICNVNFGGDEWGLFKGPEESYINLSMKKDTVALSQQKPILVARQGLYEKNDIVTINDRPWLIIEADTSSSPIIGYYSLQATTVSKNKDGGELTRPPKDDVVQDAVHPLQQLTIATENGYFECNRKLTNLNITLDTITFIVPFGIEDFIIQVQENGAVKEIKYKVV